MRPDFTRPQRRQRTAFFMSRFLACGFILAFSLVSARATITFTLTIRQEVKPAYHSNYAQTWFYALPTVSDTSNPISYHRVESPTDSCSANFGTNSATSTLAFDNAAVFFDQLTNGNWKLWLNRETPAEVLYTFTITSVALATNPINPITISAPLDGAINVTNQPPYSWIGPANCDAINVSVDNLTSAALTGTATNWSAGPVLNPGTNFFRVASQKDATSDFMISAPTNEIFGLLNDWVAGNVNLEFRASAGFIVAGLPPSALAQALDAPGLIWETSGAADWFSQPTITRDGLSAARSGVIGNDVFTTIRTLIYGSNTITFWWRADSEGSADYVEFSDNGIYVDDLTGDTGWQKFTYPLAPGTAHWLEWTYYKDEAVTDGADAVFLDQVRLAGDPGFPEGEPLTFFLSISRHQPGAYQQANPDQTWLRALPVISGPTNPLSYHRVESPHNFCWANWGTTNTSSGSGLTLNFDDLTTELTNGPWKVWLNKETPAEQFYTFNLTVLAFNSNDLGGITITAPMNGATNISAAPTFTWSGLPSWDDLFVEASQERFGTNHQYAYDWPTPLTTNWANGPTLSSGTNYFSVRYQISSATNFSSSKPFLNWMVGAITFESTASTGFIVPPPVPRPLLNSGLSGSDFQFQFLSEAGRNHLVQSRPNLEVGIWENRTNLFGDGLLQTITLPIGNEPMEFFRVVTE